MADYQVPQFIEVEDKIFGPFTLKQFVYVAGGIGLCAILLLYLPLVLGIILAVPVGAFTVALAFVKINNKPFVDILEAGFNYYIGNRLYIWKKDRSKPAPPTQAPVAAPQPQKLTLTQSRLQDLARTLDVQDQEPGNTP